MSLTLHFLRHGQTALSRDDVFCGSGLDPELTPEGQTREYVAREYHDEYVSWLADPAWHAPTGGELAIAVGTRSLRVIDDIRCQFTDGNILIVSHKATIRIILCGLLGIDVGRFRYRLGCPVGAVSVVEFSQEGPLLHSLADRSHLSESLRSLPGT